MRSTNATPTSSAAHATLTLLLGLLLVPALACGPTAEEERGGIDPAVLDQRDATFARILANSINQLQPLQNLSRAERDAVVALVTLTHTTALYDSSELPEHEALRALILQAFTMIPYEMRPVWEVGSYSVFCREEALAFEQAMSSCRLGNPDAEEIDCPQARAPGEAEITCTLTALSEIEHQTLVAGSRNLPPVAAPPPIRELPNPDPEIIESDRMKSETMERELP